MLATATPATAQQSTSEDQRRAFAMKESGNAMPLPVLKKRIERKMQGAVYLSSEMRGDIYRLKYMRNGQVIWIDVDARTGRILRTSE